MSTLRKMPRLKGQMIRRNLWLIGGGILLAGLTLGFTSACSGAASQEVKGEFPAFAYNSAVTLSGYKTAQRMPREVLAAIPCYCGCGQVQGHKSLKDCFFQEDGSFGDHASNCHVCAAEAVDIGAWYDEGLPLKQIRAQIDAKYSQYGTPTDTPPVTE